MRPSDELVIAQSGDIPPLNVFVHLAHDKDPEKWRTAFHAGTLVGRNDETPYGYGRANSLGCQVTFSRSLEESRLEKARRLAYRVALGFDYLHALRQRDAIRAADVVWTHTESQFLGVASIIRNSARRPRVIAQAVWLLDRWPTLTPLHKILFKQLIRNVDILTTHSELNASLARELFPKTKVLVVPFGIPSENPTPPVFRSTDPVRVLAVGNDRHRDWSTLIEAFGNQENYAVEIISSTVSKSLIRNVRNVTVRSLTKNSDLIEAYAKATIAVVPLRPNLHASGATVTQEAVLAGIPLVVTDAGGLKNYFDDSEVTFVRTRDAKSLRDAVADLLKNPNRALQMAGRAQAKMASGALGADAYIKRHVELSRDLIA